MAKYIVDIPPINSSNAWIEIEHFDTKEAAIDFCQKYYGADEFGNVNLISEIDEELYNKYLFDSEDEEDIV